MFDYTVRSHERLRGAQLTGLSERTSLASESVSLSSSFSYLARSAIARRQLRSALPPQTLRGPGPRVVSSASEKITFGKKRSREPLRRYQLTRLRLVCCSGCRARHFAGMQRVSADNGRGQSEPKDTAAPASTARSRAQIWTLSHLLSFRRYSVA